MKDVDYVRGASKGYTLLKCANRIRPSALHMTINSTNTRASLEVVKLVKFPIKKGNEKLLYNTLNNPSFCSIIRRITNLQST